MDSPSSIALGRATTPSGSETNSAQDRIRLEAEWKAALGGEFEKPYMRNLRAFLVEELAKGKKIYPAPKNIFRALELTPLSKVKVVILGQDPYHGSGQAHGLCFSVEDGVKSPPSLVNILNELGQDLGCAPPKSGNLSHWAQEGVLLLNTCLTVEEGRPLSHQNRGWEIFTDKIITLVNGLETPVVFLLWGAPAQKKATLITSPHHLVLKAPHPSPLSAHRGFMGCKHFSQTNEYLFKNNLRPVQWLG